MLQAWAGGFYLLNKIFFAVAECDIAGKRRLWRIISWTVYLVGLPAWLWIFQEEHNWMALGVELGGAPAMVLGLVIAIRGLGNEPSWLRRVAWIAAILGFSYSIYDFGGLNTWTQAAELGVVVGFLIGTNLLARERATGYLWFLLMNASCAWLMYQEDYYWLLGQQVISFFVVLDAYRINRRRQKT